MNTYPAISAACLLISLDNGGINRERSIASQSAEFAAWMKGNEARNLPEIEAWLASLSPDDFENVCIGAEAGTELLALAPDGTDDFLEAYFEQVC